MPCLWEWLLSMKAILDRCIFIGIFTVTNLNAVRRYHVSFGLKVPWLP